LIATYFVLQVDISDDSLERVLVTYLSDCSAWGFEESAGLSTLSASLSSSELATPSFSTFLAGKLAKRDIVSYRASHDVPQLRAIHKILWPRRIQGP
jgi:hypothetical protein